MNKLTRLLLIRIAILPVTLLILVGIVHCQENNFDNSSLYKLTFEIEKGKEELRITPLLISRKTLSYVETLRRSDGTLIKLRRKDFAWKEIGLKVFSPSTEEVRIIKIRKEGVKLITFDNNFAVVIEKRPSGITWNGWNTSFDVEDRHGARWWVIGTKWPNRLSDGSRKDLIYIPYSKALHRPAFVVIGHIYLDLLIKKAGSELNRLGIQNTERDFTSPAILDSIKKRILLEHSDYFEFKEFINNRWFYSPFDRVAVIIGLNLANAYNQTSSPARASGLKQYTKKTWIERAQKHKWAKLPIFEVGVRDHVESVKAAMLLDHDNSIKLVESFGTGITHDPNFEYYIAAAYNGGVGHVIRALKRSKNKETDWKDELKKIKKTNENLEYMEKLEYLILNVGLNILSQQNLPDSTIFIHQPARN